jgi:hypothetical protein
VIDKHWRPLIAEEKQLLKKLLAVEPELPRRLGTKSAIRRPTTPTLPRTSPGANAKLHVQSPGIMTANLPGVLPQRRSTCTHKPPNNDANLTRSSSTQFGLDDVKLNGRLIDEAFTSSEVRAEIHRVLRQKWIEAGCPWRSSSRKPPPNWDSIRQMREAGIPLGEIYH